MVRMKAVALSLIFTFVGCAEMTAPEDEIRATASAESAGVLTSAREAEAVELGAGPMNNFGCVFPDIACAYSYADNRGSSWLFFAQTLQRNGGPTLVVTRVSGDARLYKGNAFPMSFDLSCIGVTQCSADHLEPHSCRTEKNVAALVTDHYALTASGNSASSIEGDRKECHPILGSGGGGGGEPPSCYQLTWEVYNPATGHWEFGGYTTVCS
jgi:hypothetical protein